MNLELSETLERCFPLIGEFQMTVERFTEADNAYQNKRSVGSSYRPEPTAPNYAELSSLVDERDRALRAREEARTDLSYHLFKSDHLTLAFESHSSLPTWKDDLPVLRETIRRVRGLVIGRTNPFESQKEDPKRWEADLGCLSEWQHKIKAYEDGIDARNRGTVRPKPRDLIDQSAAAALVTCSDRTIQRCVDAGFLRGYGSKGARKVSRAEVNTNAEQIRDRSWKQQVERSN